MAKGKGGFAGGKGKTDPKMIAPKGGKKGKGTC